jgi:hypothetical protein
MRLSKRMARVYALLFAMGLIFAYAVYAGDKDPIGAESLTVIDSQRLDDWGGSPVVAEAGNVSELFINATGITKHWAGFYGNISGIITLDDANNWTMYNWIELEPQGEVYASTRNPPTWASIDCLNFTSGFTNAELEQNLSMETNDEDGVNETFCPSCVLGDETQNHGEFWVGYKKFSGNDCWNIHTYVSDQPQSDNFTEVLLQDGTGPVYMTIIENDIANTKGKAIGFDSRLHDFQLMVGENGNGSNILYTTQYYFYVELE